MNLPRDRHSVRYDQVLWSIVLLAAFPGFTWFLLHGLLQPGGFTLALPWTVPTLEGLAALSGICVGLLCLGRLRARPGPLGLLIGLAFWTSSFTTIFHIASWPDLFPGRDFRFLDLSTSCWLLVLGQMAVLGFSISASISLRPSGRRARSTALYALYFALAAIASTALATATLSIGTDLPALVSGDWAWSPLQNGVFLVLAILAMAATLLLLRAHFRTGDPLPAYVAVSSSLLIFVQLAALSSADFHDGWWMATQIAVLAAYLVPLGSLLREYLALFRCERRRAAEAEALVSLSRDIASNLDIKTVANSALSHSLALTGATSGFLNLLNESGKLEMVSIAGMDWDRCPVAKERDPVFTDLRGVNAPVVRLARPYRTNDVAHDRHSIGTPPGHPVIHSFLGVPLVFRERVIGEVALANKPGGFSPEDERIVSALAAQAATAVQNALVFGRVETELRALAKASQSITAGSETPVAAEAVLVELRSLLGADSAWLVTTAKTTGRLEVSSFQASPSESGPAPVPESSWQVIEEAFYGQKTVFACQMPGGRMCVAPMPGEPNWARAMLAVPLLVREEAAGVIGLQWNTPGKPSDLTQEEIELLSAFASHIAIALETGRLYQEVDRQRAFLDNALDEVPACILVVGATDGLVKKANSCFRSFLAKLGPFGCPVGVRFDSLPPLNVDTGLSGTMHRVARTGEPSGKQRLEYHLPSGEVTYWSWSVVPLMEQGRVSDNLLVMLIDTTPEVTARQQAERDAGLLKTERNRLKATIDSMPEGVCIVTAPDGHISLMNDAARLILGIRAATPPTVRQLMERYSLTYPSGEPCDIEAQPIMRSMTRGERCSGEEIVVGRPDGRSTTLLVNSTPLLGTAGDIAGAVAIFQDIGQMKEVERLRDDFLAATSHELKTPLTSIKGYAQLLLKQARRGAEVDDAIRALEIINREIERMSGLVNRLLDLPRGDEMAAGFSFRTVCFDQLAGDVLERWRPMLKRHSLHFLVDRSNVAVHCDPAMIERVLGNLIENAVKFSPSGGDVTVSVATKTNEVVVSVTDQGIGVPDECRTRLFDRFFRAENARRRNFSGLGLGLYLSRRIVEGHGGKIWVESQEGQGSKFCFTLVPAEEPAFIPGPPDMGLSIGNPDGP